MQFCISLSLSQRLSVVLLYDLMTGKLPKETNNSAPHSMTVSEPPPPLPPRVEDEDEASPPVPPIPGKTQT